MPKNRPHQKRNIRILIAIRTRNHHKICALSHLNHLHHHTQKVSQVKSNRTEPNQTKFKAFICRDSYLTPMNSDSQQKTTKTHEFSSSISLKLREFPVQTDRSSISAHKQNHAAEIISCRYEKNGFVLNIQTNEITIVNSIVLSLLTSF